MGDHQEPLDPSVPQDLLDLTDHQDHQDQQDQMDHQDQLVSQLLHHHHHHLHHHQHAHQPVVHRRNIKRRNKYSCVGWILTLISINSYYGICSKILYNSMHRKDYFCKFTILHSVIEMVAAKVSMINVIG